jgi:hypothetical protein
MKQHANEVVLTAENIEVYASEAIRLDGENKNGPYFKAIREQAERQDVAVPTE